MAHRKPTRASRLFAKSCATSATPRGKTFRWSIASLAANPSGLRKSPLIWCNLVPDVIFALGGDVVPAAQKATKTIPIVMLVSNDPVRTGIIRHHGPSWRQHYRCHTHSR